MPKGGLPPRATADARPRLTLAVFAGLLWLLCSGIAFFIVKAWRHL
jgi:hypothetical protein